MSTAAIIVAAGDGSRLPGDTPKQLVALAGKPMVAWSAEKLRSVCDGLVVVAPAGRVDAVGEMLGDANTVPGGETRQESVWNGLQALPEGTTRVLIHDAARPCVSRALLDRIVAALDRHDAVVPAVGAVDTLVRERDGAVEAILDRVHVSGVQTPQAFAVDVIVRAHAEARKRGFHSSDDGSLVLAIEEPVATVPGDRMNLKVTYPEDLAIAEAILELSERK
jgi:2-C-methyl-D-erythritol 4-phosphate cytidylyltransferase